MEASALPASAGLTRARLGLGAPLLRLRSDEQLVSLFRAGNEDAFRVIHDRYRSRMLAYARQMLAASPADAEDAVQEIFVRAYGGLRANRRDLALRAWLYRIAHNRCIDDLRRPHAIAVDSVEDLGEAGGAAGSDPHARVEQREALRRLIADVQRLPEQQRSALLMRELGGMPYADLAGALGVSVPAVKSLLVRARVGLVQAHEARDTACDAIREDLIGAHDRGVRSSGRARRHLRDCPECRRFRGEVQGMSRSLGLLVPALGPVAVLAKLIGLGGGGGAAASSGTGAVAGGGAAAASTTAVAASGGAVAGVGASGAAISAGAAAGAGHVAAVVAATVIAAGGALGIQHAVSSGHPAHAAHGRAERVAVVADLPRAAPAPVSSAGERSEPAADRSSATAGSSPTASTTHAGSGSTGTPSATSAVASAQQGVGRVTRLSSSSSAVSGDPAGTATTTASGSTTSTDPTSTDPTTTATTGTATSTTASSATSTSSPTSTGPTTGTTSGPSPGGEGTPTGTSTTPSTTGTGAGIGSDPGTSTGIGPTVTSATPSTGIGRPPRHLRLRTWRYARRGVQATSSAVN